MISLMSAEISMFTSPVNPLIELKAKYVHFAIQVRLQPNASLLTFFAPRAIGDLYIQNLD